MSERTIIMDDAIIKRTIVRMANDILEKNNGTDNLCIVGIRTRGVYLADRIAEYIEKAENCTIPKGILDITFHRDDLGFNDSLPEIKQSDIPFDVNGKIILLVDDVLYTGRTIRAAIETVMDYGRPKKIRLAVLIDRGHRDLPICADYTGKSIPTSKDEAVSVSLREHDGKDCVEIYKINKKG
ncbi:MAG: bifunctional pyr operon transcriptional regulator/uracil phosphoribosyltransferase PyrR [Clostridia bacterium]|nr:bifunctional pyr operon transcriptional regulator/uracil phosphoribosyltransferase PyrR [Clostridia bacterium]